MGKKESMEDNTAAAQLCPISIPLQFVFRYAKENKRHPKEEQEEKKRSGGLSFPFENKTLISKATGRVSPSLSLSPASPLSYV